MRRLLLAILAACAITTAPAHARPPKVGEIAPDALLTLVDGTKLKLSELRGQVIVLNFWATWCAPCREELPTLNAYYALQRKHGLRVFAVATEDSVPERFMRGLFAKLAISPVHRLKGPYATLRAVPTNFIIDRAGVVRYAAAAAFDLDDLNRLLVPLLNEPPPSVPSSS